MALITAITQRLEYMVEKLPWTYLFFKKYYDQIIDKEIKLADIKETDRILCIGGGPCPCTAIELHKRTGARVWVVDNDREVVYNALRNIERLNLSDFVSVKYADGRDICPKAFDIIHIALQVTPKGKVFENLINKARPGTKILVRIATDKYSKLYSSLDIAEAERGIYKKINHNRRNLDYTFLYVTAGGLNEEVLKVDNNTALDSIAI